MKTKCADNLTKWNNTTLLKLPLLIGLMIPFQSVRKPEMSVSHLIEGGAASIPRAAPWLEDFRHELSLFPNGRHDDQVDSLSQFLVWFMKKSRKSFFVA